MGSAQSFKNACLLKQDADARSLLGSPTDNIAGPMYCRCRRKHRLHAICTICAVNAICTIRAVNAHVGRKGYPHCMEVCTAAVTRKDVLWYKHLYSMSWLVTLVSGQRYGQGNWLMQA